MSDLDLSTLEGHKKLLEAAILSSDHPIPLNELMRLFDGEADEATVRKILDDLKDEWSDRGVVLAQVAEGWKFKTNSDYQMHLAKLKNERPPRYSRAVLETLAIIAYRQPLTRGEIEEIRGVVVSSGTLKILEARGWIEIVGHRNSPGQPALYATTGQFLNDLLLKSLEDLPSLADIESSLEQNGIPPLLSGVIPESVQQPNLFDNLEEQNVEALNGSEIAPEHTNSEPQPEEGAQPLTQNP